MFRRLLDRTFEQAVQRDPLVNAMVLLRGAPVLSAVDRDAARRAFADGVRLAESLRYDTRRLDFILDEAVKLGATADPEGAVALFRRLPVGERAPWG